MFTIQTASGVSLRKYYHLHLNTTGNKMEILIFYCKYPIKLQPIQEANDRITLVSFSQYLQNVMIPVLSHIWTSKQELFIIL